jgi:hypothetical protein
LSRRLATAEAVPGQPVPSAGSVVFEHAYAPPAKGAAFSKRVSVLSALAGRELLAGNLVIIPRYRVTQQAIEFSPLNHCDSVFEETTEWEVFTDGRDPPYEHWRFDRHTADRGGVGVPLPDFGVLPDSAVSVETIDGNRPFLP